MPTFFNSDEVMTLQPYPQLWFQDLSEFDSTARGPEEDIYWFLHHKLVSVRKELSLPAHEILKDQISYPWFPQNI